ncbi:glycosyltransferase family 2 protein [Pseudonocardia nematodicida]|uniref:Glycosyltransferase family 2 protein n=1 Tax=Pseudonocardia nematodicida TaxID=1206997 RepID=A0ABV1KG09_9PSEU
MRGTIEAVGVLVPARDEEQRIGRCLDAVHRALRHAGVPGLVCVVADRCTDRTADVAAGRAEVVGTTRPRPIGAVRDLGARRLLGRLPGAAWILSTDADSVVPRSWVADHLRHAAAGADAVAGAVELDDPGTLPEIVRERYDRVLRAPSRTGTGHAYAAALGVRASALRAVGGFPAVPVGEEHALLARLRAAGFAVVWADDAAVRTSARTVGRATGGLAGLLADLRTEVP